MKIEDDQEIENGVDELMMMMNLFQLMMIVLHELVSAQVIANDDNELVSVTVSG